MRSGRLYALTSTPHAAPTSPGTDDTMGNVMLKLNVLFATNQHICATPHISPERNAGPAHGGSSGFLPCAV
jgi:hypothetical protein